MDRTVNFFDQADRENENGADIAAPFVELSCVTL
jgi:hypothetical protein